jgi:hypothetical protein
MSSWKNRLKNSDNDYYSPKDLILAMEKMFKIEHYFKNKALKASEEKTLIQSYKELLDHIISLAEKPFKEPQTDEEKRYFREPFVSYCTEMISYYIRIEIIDHLIKRNVSNFLKLGFYFYLEDELAYSEYENEILKKRIKEKLEKEQSNQPNDDEIFNLTTLELREKMKKKLSKSIK